MKIYTKTGDHGDTGLFGGTRVEKDNVRVEAYGTLDELNAFVGVARAAQADASMTALLGEIQPLLFELGAELASPPSATLASAARLGEAEVSWLEQRIDAAEAELEPLRHFVLPGGTPGAAALHVCRAVCRRAERRLVALRHSEPATGALGVVFLNRLGDLLFVLARLANHHGGVTDAPWTPRPRVPTSRA